jgi:hypothetical protein
MSAADLRPPEPVVEGLMRRALGVARRAREHGNHPGGAEVIRPLLEDEARAVHDGFW